MPKKQLQLIIIGTVVAIIAGFFSLYEFGLYTLLAPGNVERIEAQRAYHLIQNDDLTIIDVRTEEEFKVSHLPNALHYSPSMLDTLDTSKPIMVYCTISLRSNSVAKEFSNRGYEEVYDIKGGLISWSNQQYEMVDEQKTQTDTVHTYTKWLAPFVRKGNAVF